MPRTSTTGLDKKQYQRWKAAGEPDLKAYKAAGCPTARDWKKRLAGPKDQAPAPAPTKSPVKRSSKRAATKPTPAKQPATATAKATTSSCTIHVKALHLSYEGDAADIPALLQKFLGLIQ